ncbi:hypothetical protein BKA70DRAFT_1180925 [Coprinopsis sp. MPI-PUGE-AT-0042]|nr:hypothetical protein BKA70DRAFT_1180925 [Coprinopsis sp. MPI-PUGE-AT-0042]
MLRASSAGLTSAILSAASASRPWQASCTIQILKAVARQNVRSHQPQARGIRLRAANSASIHPRTPPQYLATQRQVEGGGETTRMQPRPELRVKRQREPRRVLTSRAKTGIKQNKRAVRFQRSGSRSSNHRLLLAPTPHRGGHHATASVLDGIFSRNRAGTGQRDHGHAPFRLHPNIVTLLYRTFEENVAAKLVRLLRTAAAGQDLDESWHAYATLIHLQSTDSTIARKFRQIPNAVLHRLARHIARTRPVTKSHFPRLLRVLQHLWDTKNPLPVEAWNTLINCAGKGHRTGSRKEYDMAVSIFYDMTGGLRPGMQLSQRMMLMGDARREATQPDLITFNTLLTIAARSLSKRSLEHAVSLFKQSGFAPDWITHMALMMYHIRMKNLGGVRATLRKMATQGLQLPLDGVNAVIWAFAYSGHNDVVLDIYRVLSNNVRPDVNQGEIKRAIYRLQGVQSLTLSANLRPDVVTYTVVIQATARAGDFTNAFTILHDFVSIHCHRRLTPSAAAAFRAIFLGFKTFAVDPASPIEPLPTENKWTLDNLTIVYELFLQLPAAAIPTRSTIFWIMDAFDKTCGHDVLLLQRVWLELKHRYEPLKPTLFHQPRLRRMEINLFSAREEDVVPKRSNTLHGTPEP